MGNGYFLHGCGGSSWGDNVLKSGIADGDTVCAYNENYRIHGMCIISIRLKQEKNQD